MIPRRQEEVEPTPSTPLSPRSSSVSNDSRFLYDDDFLESPVRSPASVVSMWDEKKPRSKIRHAVGIALLLATVFLWTASNFLASVRSIPCEGTNTTNSARPSSQTPPTTSPTS
jgi:solute carrier family 35 protein F5